MFTCFLFMKNSPKKVKILLENKNESTQGLECHSFIGGRVVEVCVEVSVCVCGKMQEWWWGCRYQVQPFGLKTSPSNKKPWSWQFKFFTFTTGRTFTSKKKTNKKNNNWWTRSSIKNIYLLYLSGRGRTVQWAWLVCFYIRHKLHFNITYNKSYQSKKQTKGNWTSCQVTGCLVQWLLSGRVLVLDWGQSVWSWFRVQNLQQKIKSNNKAYYCTLVKTVLDYDWSVDNSSPLWLVTCSFMMADSSVSRSL